MSDVKTPAPEAKEIPSLEDLCLSTPLYHHIPLPKGHPLYNAIMKPTPLDFHCPECERHSTFTPIGNNSYNSGDHPPYRNYIFSRLFQCSRNDSHRAFFVFRAHGNVLQKIGQTPSLADLAMPDLRRYRPVLGEERMKELNRGIGLATHGVGVGAFVYLRRIFEWQIETAKTAASIDQNWDEEAYKIARMDEKISLLKSHLPEFLVQNRSLYGILSVGVHSLSEKDCLAAFPAVRLAIELILDDLLEKYEKKLKVAAASKSLEALKARL